jgi:hypothetical protein
LTNIIRTITLYQSEDLYGDNEDPLPSWCSKTLSNVNRSVPQHQVK